MIIESHAHYSHIKFDQTFPCLTYDDGKFAVGNGDREGLLARVREKGVIGVVEPAIGIGSNENVLKLHKQYEGFIFPAYGCHPSYTFLAKWEDREVIERYAGDPDCGCIAVGETGLDYHYKELRRHKSCQKRWFVYQIELANKLNKPLILHIRKAKNDALRILKRHRKLLTGGVVHCFCDDRRTAAKYIKLGFHIGIGGALLTEESKDRLSNAVRRIPLDRILVETDAPYMLPDCDVYKSKKQRKNARNTSLILKAVIERIAEIKELPVEEVEKVLLNNTVELFSIEPFSE
ncbi:MAG: TatD family hydrolase [Clostridia bacterium]|nr:TatD family hydrolase [Clostridia bacterium]